MIKIKSFQSLLIVFILIATPSLAKAQPFADQDKYESFNRQMFEFNLKFNDLIGEPVARYYKNHTPVPIQTGTSNFLTNLKMPLNMVNNFLQGEVERGLNDFMRFVVNTVFGFGGFIDIATPAGLYYEKEDLGQTLYKWGVWEEANFLVMPFIGAYTSRELVSGSVEGFYNPTFEYIIQTDLTGRVVIFGADKFNSYVSVIELVDQMKSMPDPYIFYRESYLQYRTNLIYNGRPPLPELDDFDFD